nr:tRNA lysidine(34) synthetase TilS [Allomuricauda sp.]
MFLKFKEHIAKNLPLLKDKRLLLACSGGLDSMVLAHLCLGLGLDIELAHCNFKLRGAESNGDEDFVRNSGRQWGVQVHVKHFETEEYARNHGISIQMAARDLRYQWFTEILDNTSCGYVLTAHHADDSLETFLINLSRGTGLDGLSGIPEINGKVIRPLLPFSQKELLGYAKSENINWREDSSNASTKYLRNKIRHQIVPLLKELHPTFLQNFLRTQNNLGQSNGILKNSILELKDRVFQPWKGDIKIRIEDLRQLDPLDAHLYGLFNDFGFTEWDDVKGLLSAESGKQVFSRTHRMVKDRDCLILSKLQSNAGQSYYVHIADTRIDRPVKLLLEDVRCIDERAKNVVFLDKEKLNFPLVLRNWINGDYFYPFGMKGKKKVSKFFKDEKMDLVSKEKQWLLCSDNKIVWVVGKRADERFKVDDSTRKILKITQIT